MSGYRYLSEVIVVSGSVVERRSVSMIDVEMVGVKAHGMLALPITWVPEFFCVTCECVPAQSMLNEAGALVGIGEDDPVLVRSSGTREGMAERGALHSELCSLRDASVVLKKLASSEDIVRASKVQDVHFIVQRRVKTVSKGHLSNERRVAKKARDWRAEVEPSPGQLAESGSVAVRKWREGDTEYPVLACHLRANIFRTLRVIAKWARGSRLHWEWVWDGERIWVVQCEPADVLSGTNPKRLAKASKGAPSLVGAALSHFHVATAAEFSAFRKLANARVYKELGYTMPIFYVCSDAELLERIQESGVVPPTMLADLQILCGGPFILRTDGLRIPEDRRQMLPRSDELRSAESAQRWLIEDFREKLNGIDLRECECALIGHHFLPSLSSAWARAYPRARRVRIESLWGIPEGLYYFPHDVFEVDVTSMSVGRRDESGSVVLMSHSRFKSKFIAPDSDGNWQIHQVSAPHDWAMSIGREAWVKEIAHTTRAIADSLDRPVVVMWFVGLVSAMGDDVILPWYHEEWKAREPSQTSALGKQHKAGRIELITCDADLRRLQGGAEALAGVSRIAVVPKDSAIVRDTRFIDELAALVAEKEISIELHGGMLSHVYYTLQRAGCDVICMDEVGIADESIDFNKLVRDKVPDVIESRGEDVAVIRLANEALLHALKSKLIEEAFEVVDASNVDSIVEELADVMEVVSGIARVLDVDKAAIELARKRKFAHRGGFDRGLMLQTTTLSAEPTSAELQAKVEDLPLITAVQNLPKVEEKANFDRRLVRGVAERLVTFTVPLRDGTYGLNRPSFDLETPIGDQHPMRLEINAERRGADLRVRLVLGNAPYQLGLFDVRSSAVVSDAEKAGGEE